ncbi:MAG: C1 family peptidase [Candidatus Sumerlaeota bacterium]|nr:C1 family peptidase [Candidatus Sumerlaeota bacterium]
MPSSHEPQTTNGALTPERLAELRREFADHPTARLMQNAVTQTSVDDVALNRSIVTQADHTFSNLLDDWKVTNQKSSGRCWMFAGLNLLRVGAMKTMKLKNFELSQNYTLFCDKIERANYFLEAILETAALDVGDRTVAWLLAHPIDDGGQWNMFANVVRKYGVLPKALMPETESSSNTRRMNAALRSALREGAKTIRDQRAAGASSEALRAAKQRILSVVFRVLCVHLGTPPKRFLWQWNDKDKAFHRDGELSPCEFAEKYLAVPIDEYVCLVHDPRPTSPMGRTFTVQYLGNVVDGRRVIYLNVPIELMKEIAMRTIVEGEPVWFGCDVGKMMRRDLGLWDAKLFDYAGVYDARFGLGKADRLFYHETLMTHAMLFTGVDVVDGKPRRWRVENSWGEESGQKGFYIMNDSWFDEYMFEVAARRNYLPEDLQRALEIEPIVLPPWDPMGSLART